MQIKSFKLALVLAITILVGGMSTAQRSFVGKSLEGITFTDTEGHTIVPAHYKGSVLVMYSGIPW